MRVFRIYCVLIILSINQSCLKQTLTSSDDRNVFQWTERFQEFSHAWMKYVEFKNDLLFPVDFKTLAPLGNFKDRRYLKTENDWELFQKETVINIKNFDSPLLRDVNSETAKMSIVLSKKLTLKDGKTAVIILRFDGSVSSIRKTASSTGADSGVGSK